MGSVKRCIVFFRSLSGFFLCQLLKIIFMNTNETKEGTNRRNFLGTIATGAAAIGFTSIAPSISAFAGETKLDPKVYGDPEEMFKKINGKHRVVFDSPPST